jgi:uncharacterized protein YjiS (DUF1127 family)
LEKLISVSAPVFVATPPRPGFTLLNLLARYGAWLCRLNDAAALREMEPHRARDIGVAPGCDRAPDNFVVDPRPLWGIGLTPQPTEAMPPWSKCGRPR